MNHFINVSFSRHFNVNKSLHGTTRMIAYVCDVSVGDVMQCSVKAADLSCPFDGIVEQVGLRTTQIRSFDGTLHYIPNRNITNVSNHSRGTMQALVDIKALMSTRACMVPRE